MPPTRRTLLGAAGASTLAGLLPNLAFAQSWPSKPIRFVVPFAPGGSSEIIARSTAAELTKTLGQSVFVDNKPGASGNIAMAEVARADDQHTIILGHIGTLAVNPYMFDKIPYDPVKDFKPVSLLAKVPSLYVVHPDVPAKNLKEFIALVKAKPGTMNYGSAGNGSAGHLAMEYLKMTAGLFITHIPYRGTGPALTDVLAGRIEFFSAGTPALMPHIKSGALRCIAVGSAKRIAALPDVPSVSELYPGFETVQWYGMHARAGTPPEIIRRMEQECAKAVRAPDVLAKFEAESATADGTSAREYADFVRKEQTRWKDIVIRANIKPN